MPAEVTSINAATTDDYLIGAEHYVKYQLTNSDDTTTKQLFFFSQNEYTFPQTKIQS